jgi:putative solute:sodium symporter small subunit
MSDGDMKQAYWTRVRFTVVVAVAATVFLSAILPIVTASLNGYRFMRFPLGYFLASIVAVLACCLLVYIVFSIQARLEQRYSLTVQF